MVGSRAGIRNDGLQCSPGVRDLGGSIVRSTRKWYGEALTSICGDGLGWVRKYKFASITEGHSVNQPVPGWRLREVATNWAWVNQRKREGRAEGNGRVASGDSEVRLRG
jgi:hypothetical protein